MSVHISSRAWKVKGLTFAEKLVLVRLADMTNDEGVCWPSFVTIARDIEIDVRSVRRIAARLEGKGLLSRSKRFKEGGLQTTNWLTVLPPDDRVAAADPLPDSSGLIPGPVSPPYPDRSVLPTRTGRSSRPGPGSPPEPSLNHQLILGQIFDDLGKGKEGAISAFERSRLLAGQSLTLGGVLILPGSPEAERLHALLRVQRA